MNKYLYILLFCILIISCNRDPFQGEKEDLKNLDKRVRVLEEELHEIKSRIEQTNTEDAKHPLDNTDVYFMIGSTTDEVLEAMGEPDSYLKTAPEAKKFNYGLSTVYFYQDRVISFENLEKNLKVKVK